HPHHRYLPISPSFPYTTLFRSDVIPMRVARDHDFDVLDFETELLHVRNDHIVHFGRARIEQNVALWRGDQIGAILAAHPINVAEDRKSTRLNSSHGSISYAVFC